MVHEREKKLDELNMLNLFQLGDILNKFGKKHKNISIKEIYEKDRAYIKWIKTSTSESDFTEIEYCRKALILYYDTMEYLKAQGR